MSNYSGPVHIPTQLLLPASPAAWLRAAPAAPTALHCRAIVMGNDFSFVPENQPHFQITHQNVRLRHPAFARSACSSNSPASRVWVKPPFPGPRFALDLARVQRLVVQLKAHEKDNLRPIQRHGGLAPAAWPRAAPAAPIALLADSSGLSKLAVC